MRDITNRILNAVAYREGCDVLDLPPLYDAIDPEALEETVQNEVMSDIEFTYNGYQIRVEQGGNVHIAAEVADA